MHRQHVELLDALRSALEQEANASGIRLAEALAAFEETPEDSYCYTGSYIELATAAALALLDLPRIPEVHGWLVGLARDLLGSGDVPQAHCLGSPQSQRLYFAWTDLLRWSNQAGGSGDEYVTERLQEAVQRARGLLAG